MACRHVYPLLKTLSRIQFTNLQQRAHFSKNACLNPKLFTPGPLGVSNTTKEAMLRDVGSKDQNFIKIIKNIRGRLVTLAGVSCEEYTCVPMQGAGTFAIEAVLGTAIPRGGKILILENGAYGVRQKKICQVLGIDYHLASFPEDTIIRGGEVYKLLKKLGAFSMVSVVHCETSSGVFNDVVDIGNVVKSILPNSTYFVDAMSSFGAVPLNIKDAKIDYLVSSANKCIEGVPGFGYALCKTEHLSSCKGNARSYSLDLVDQWKGLESNGQFRFTPPTHVMLAFNQALSELQAEGGVKGRSQRYKQNRDVLRTGMKKIGFKEFLDEDQSGYIITSYHFPTHPNFNFTEFYQRLGEKGMVIYPGKVLDADCFRIGNIGHLYPADVEDLISAIGIVCKDMNMPIPL